MTREELGKKLHEIYKVTYDVQLNLIDEILAEFNRLTEEVKAQTLAADNLARYNNEVLTLKAEALDRIIELYETDAGWSAIGETIHDYIKAQQKPYGYCKKCGEVFYQPPFLTEHVCYGKPTAEPLGQAQQKPLHIYPSDLLWISYQGKRWELQDGEWVECKEKSSAEDVLRGIIIQDIYSEGSISGKLNKCITDILEKFELRDERRT